MRGELCQQYHTVVLAWLSICLNHELTFKTNALINSQSSRGGTAERSGGGGGGGSEAVVF